MTTSWTPEELRLLHDAKRELTDSVERPTLLFGATEAGEAWCCIVSKATGQIVVGFGKVRADYIIRVVPSLPGDGVRCSDLQTAIQSFLLSWLARHFA